MERARLAKIFLMPLKNAYIYLTLPLALVEPANAALPTCISDMQIYTDQASLDPISSWSRDNLIEGPPLKNLNQR